MGSHYLALIPSNQRPIALQLRGPRALGPWLLPEGGETAGRGWGTRIQMQGPPSDLRSTAGRSPGHHGVTLICKDFLQNTGKVAIRKSQTGSCNSLLVLFVSSPKCVCICTYFRMLS